MNVDALVFFERLNKSHNRTEFSCGIEPLDTYLKTQIRQDERRNLAFAYVMAFGDDRRVMAYYTLSSASVSVENLPPAERKGIPYDVAPAALIGRLAVDQSLQGQGYGRLVLVDALRRISQSGDMAIMAVIVDPKDQNATKFYGRFGFQPLDGKGGRMYLPFKSIKGL